MDRKNKTGLWITLVTLGIAATLILLVYNQVDFVSAGTAPVTPQDNFALENNCLVCHVASMPPADWYCHNALPAENYYSRMYLRVHLDFVISTLPVPTGLYIPLVPQLPQNAFQIHLFEQKVFPASANITAGTKVTWMNLDTRDYTLQNQTAYLPWPFEPVTLKPGESVSFTFEQTGVFAYSYKYSDARPVVTPLYQTGYGKITVSAKG